MNQKTRFIKAVLTNALKIGEIIRETRDLVDVYNDRGYAGNGADPITEQDFMVSSPGENVDFNGVDLTKFNAVAGVLVDLLSFGTSVALAAKDREQPINKVRGDV